MLDIPTEKFPRLFVIKSIQQMLLQYQSRFFVLEVMGLLAPRPESAFPLHEMSTHVQFGAKVLRTPLFPVEIPAKLNRYNRFNNQRSTFVDDQKKARIKLQKRAYAVPLRALFQQAHDPLYLLDLQHVFKF